ncbi:MAG TPA: PfkB family carbohydrate kinase, partial [Nocardioidaceae bacterium]|nr:PfkB family carbohydrate kinase [Nocardioidaceae bacterium]
VTADRDTGFCVALVDADAERTFVSTLGAEGVADPDVLRKVDATDSDVVYASGYSLYHETTSAPLLRWMSELPAGATVVFDASPLIGDVRTEVLAEMVPLVSIWTLNEREALVLSDRLVGGTADGLSARAVAVRLRDALEATVLVRTGSQGCWVAAVDDDPVLVPADDVVAVDTNGAGDAHTGYLCAELSRGVALTDAVRRGNAAAAIAITRRGPATAPTNAEIDRLLPR